MHAHSAPVPRVADFQGSSGYLHIYCCIWWRESVDCATAFWLPNTHKPHFHKPIMFSNARAKILLSCHQDSWFISSPSIHIFPGKPPAWHGPCRLAQPHWPSCPRTSHPQTVLEKNTFSGPTFFVVCLGWRVLSNSPLFQGARGYTQGGYPPTWHLCEVKGTQSSNL